MANEKERIVTEEYMKEAKEDLQGIRLVMYNDGRAEDYVVFFGGKVIVGTLFNESTLRGEVVFQEGKESHPIGEDIKDKEWDDNSPTGFYRDRPRIILNFSSVKSIDVVMGALMNIRGRMLRQDTIDTEKGGKKDDNQGEGSGGEVEDSIQ